MEQVLYQLPEGWKWETLTDVTQFIGGSQPPKSEFSDTAKDGYVRLIQIRDYKTDAHIVYVDRNSTKKFCNRDDVMIGRYGPPVFQILRGLEGAYNVALMKAVPDEKILSKDYLFAFLQSSPIQSYIVGLSQRAAGQSGVNKKALENYSIPIPPMAEQKRIVEKLDALLTRIDTAIEHLQQSVTLADALYASTINEQMMQAIELAGLSTVEKHIEQIQTGTTPPTKQPEFYENGDINWFAPSDFGDHDILFDSNKKLSQKAFDAGKARKFDAGTIMLVAIGATIGKIGYLEQDASSNQQITGMKFNSAIIPRYAYYWFRFIKPEILTNASTATLPIINQKGIKALSFCAPNKQLQETICRKIDEVSNFRNKVKAELNEKVELMRSLKASILDSAFKGEL